MCKQCSHRQSPSFCLCVLQSARKVLRQSSLSAAPFSASGRALPLLSTPNTAYRQATTSPAATSPAADSMRAGPSSPASLQSQLASVTLRRRSPASPSPIPTSSPPRSLVLTPSPPAPPPLPPLSPQLGPKLASPQRQSPVTVNASVLNYSESLSTSKSVTPSHAPPPPPPPPPPPLSASLLSARSRTGNAQLQRTNSPSIPSTSRLHSNAHAQAQSSLGSERSSASPSTSASLGGVDSRARYGRQPSAGSSISRAADVARQPAASDAPRPQLQTQLASQQVSQSPVTQRSGMEQSGHQKGWRQQLDRDAEPDEAGSIAAVHASGPVPGSGAFAELQSGVKKRWPTVQSNPLYQQPDAEASTVPRPASAATTPGAGFSVLLSCKPLS